LHIGVIADSHVAVDERAYEPAVWHNPFRLVDALDRLAGTLDHPFLRDADLVVVLGDLVHYGDRPSLRAVVEAMAACTAPVVLLSGNHDVMEAAVRLEDEVDAVGASHVWSPLAGSPPRALTSLFDVAGLGLCVIEVMSMWPTPRQPFGVEARTVVDAPRGAPGVTLTHFPLLDFQERCEGAGFLYSGHLAQLAEPPPHDPAWTPHLVLNGHLHVRAVAEAPKMLQLSFAALVEAPYEIARVDVARTGDALDVQWACESVRSVDEEKVPVLDGASGTWP
jgi:hypothetical protein